MGTAVKPTTASYMQGTPPEEQMETKEQVHVLPVQKQIEDIDGGIN